MSHPPIILASRSPRRAQLLRDTGFAVVQVDPPFVDPPQPTDVHADAVADLAKHLAAAKARSVLAMPDPPAELRRGDAFLLAADTIVVSPDGELLGQPRDAVDARRMLDALVGRTHQVVTGVALVAPLYRGEGGRGLVRLNEGTTERAECLMTTHTGRRSPHPSPLPGGEGAGMITFADRARVTFGVVPADDLARYVVGGAWRGKAGAYNLAELTDRWPITVSGDATTVVGLPMRTLQAYLSRGMVKP